MEVQGCDHHQICRPTSTQSEFFTILSKFLVRAIGEANSANPEASRAPKRQAESAPGDTKHEKLRVLSETNSMRRAKAEHRESGEGNSGKGKHAQHEPQKKRLAKNVSMGRDRLCPISRIWVGSVEKRMPGRRPQTSNYKRSLKRTQTYSPRS